MKFRFNKVKLDLLLLTTIIFSNITLHTEEFIVIYGTISMFITSIVFTRLLLRKKLLNRFINNRFVWWLSIIFFVYFIYGTLLPRYEYFSVQYFVFMYITLLVVVVILLDYNASKIMEMVIKTSVLASIAVIMFVLQKEGSLIFSGDFERIGDSVSGNVNTLAIRLGIISLSSLYMIMYSKKKIYFIPYILSVIMILLTGSKKGLLIIIVSIIIFSILKNKLKVYKYFIPITALIVIIFLVFNNIYLYNIIGFRIIDFLGTLGLDIQGAQYSNSTFLRLNMYRTGIDAFLQKPLLGNGWFYFSFYSGLETYSHSNYLELLVNYGLMGLILYYSIYVYIVKELIKLVRYDNFSILLITSVIIIIINDFASVSFSFNLINYYIIAISFLYINEIKRKRHLKKDAYKYD